MGCMDKDLKNKTYQELEDILVGFGGKKYLTKYLFSFIHAQNALSLEDVTPLSKKLRDRLTQADYHISQLQTIKRFVDPDGTVKFLFEMGDGNRIEAVLLTTDTDRRTLCVSCQAGCRMGCDFCATGKMKFKRNLTAGEIADQVNQAAEHLGKINNVVYMGMGEPMDNYDHVMRSVRILMHHAGRNIGQRHITVSTCGIPEGIEKFAREETQVRLAVSLHASDDATRGKLMAVANKYPLGDILNAVDDYQRITRRRVTFEYCMIEGLNDRDQDANAIARLLRGIEAGINLIEYNPCPGSMLAPSSRDRIQQFKDILTHHGYETIIRYKRGQSIMAACGQLAIGYSEDERG